MRKEINALYSDNVSVFPSPADKQLNFILIDISQDYFISLINMQGKIAISNFELQSVIKNHTIDISNIEEGIYILRINGSKGYNREVNIAIVHNN